jgi:hypothetical protein
MAGNLLQSGLYLVVGDEIDPKNWSVIGQEFVKH